MLNMKISDDGEEGNLRKYHVDIILPLLLLLLLHLLLSVVLILHFLMPKKTCWIISSCWFSVGWEETSWWNCKGYANISSERHKTGDSTWYNWFVTDLCAERFRRLFEVIGWWIEAFEFCCCWRRVAFEFAVARKGVELRRRYRLGRCKVRRWRTEEGIRGILTV